MQIQIEAGGFRVYGNQPIAALNETNFELENQIVLYPNPTKTALSFARCKSN